VRKMSPHSTTRFRAFVPGVIAIALAGALFTVARQPAYSASQIDQVASHYKFDQMPIAMPPGYHPGNTSIRKVNPAYQHVRSWISSVGASIALTDATGHGRDDAMCIVDTRTNDVVVTYTPTAPQADRFTPFVLNPKPLPMDSTMAPMGCAPGDYNGDGRMDFLVYYWGRTPIMFLARSNHTTPSASAYRATELVPQAPGKQYTGPQWNTNAVNVADFDGDGHPDIFIGNYFPQSDVLNPHGLDNVTMNSSMSDAQNGGGDFILRWTGGTSGAKPTVSYTEAPDAIPFNTSTGWTLAAGSADLTGPGGLPALYIANDFGPDHLLYNRSTRGHIKFSVTIGRRSWTTPKSFVLGRDSFKGMGVDFADLGDSGRFDMAVSNITVAWGLEESNFIWMNQAKTAVAAKKDLASGYAPFEQKAAQMGMGWSGWGWDIKMADFDNSGTDQVVQTDGFIKGTINRWPWLQEMAVANDDLYTNPATWPLVEPGDDVGGHQALAFYAQGPNGRYVNVSKELGLHVPFPTRGIAIADTRADGALDLAVARQWGPPAFYANVASRRGNYLGLELFRPTIGGGQAGQGLEADGSPAYGAVAQIHIPGHTQIAQLDGGSGQGGKRSFEVSFGLGSYHGPVSVSLQWRDLNGQLHQQNMKLLPGTHDLLLNTAAQEVPSR
jgi:hypothetical protein